MGGEKNSRQQKEGSEAVSPTEGGRRSRAGESFPRAPGGSRVAAGVKEAKPRLLNENGSQKGCQIFRLVDNDDKISNFLEDFEKLDRFAAHLQKRRITNSRRSYLKMDTAHKGKIMHVG